MGSEVDHESGAGGRPTEAFRVDHVGACRPATTSARRHARTRSRPRGRPRNRPPREGSCSALPPHRFSRGPISSTCRFSTDTICSRSRRGGRQRIQGAAPGSGHLGAGTRIADRRPPGSSPRSPRVQGLPAPARLGTHANAAPVSAASATAAENPPGTVASRSPARMIAPGFAVTAPRHLRCPGRTNLPASPVRPRDGLDECGRGLAEAGAVPSGECHHLEVAPCRQRDGGQENDRRLLLGSKPTTTTGAGIDVGVGDAQTLCRPPGGEERRPPRQRWVGHGSRCRQIPAPPSRTSRKRRRPLGSATVRPSARGRPSGLRQPAPRPDRSPPATRPATAIHRSPSRMSGVVSRPEDRYVNAKRPLSQFHSRSSRWGRRRPIAASPRPAGHRCAGATSGAVLTRGRRAHEVERSRPKR